MGNIPAFFQRPSAEEAEATSPASSSSKVADAPPPSLTASREDDPKMMRMVPDLPTSSSGKRKRLDDNGNDDDKPTDTLQSLQQVTPTPAKKKKSQEPPRASRLAEERAAILQTLPDRFKAMSGTIGFCKFGKQQRVPALIVDPAEAPEGEVWDQWIKVYHRRLEEHKLHCLPYIVYYYCNDGNLCFGVVSLSSFIPYDVEAQKGDKGIAQLPLRFQRKVDQGKPLTFHDECMIEAYESMEEDLQKQPWERKQWEL